MLFAYVLYNWKNLMNCYQNSVALFLKSSVIIGELQLPTADWSADKE